MALPTKLAKLEKVLSSRTTNGEQTNWSCTNIQPAPHNGGWPMKPLISGILCIGLLYALDTYFFNGIYLSAFFDMLSHGLHHN